MLKEIKIALLPSLSALCSIFPYLLWTCTLSQGPAKLAPCPFWLITMIKVREKVLIFHFPGSVPSALSPWYCWGEICRHFLSRLLRVDLCLFIFMLVKGHNKSSCITSDSDSLLKSACWRELQLLLLYYLSVTRLCLSLCKLILLSFLILRYPAWPSPPHHHLLFFSVWWLFG